MLSFDRRGFLAFSAAAGAALASREAASQAAAAWGDTVAEAPGFYRFPLGQFQITTLCDGVFFLPSDSIAINAEAGERKAYFDAHFFEAGVVRLQANPLVIDTGEHRIVVDTGLAPKEHWARYAGRFTTSSNEAGVALGEVDAIVLTHCHPDHIGGLASQADLFPKAEIVLSDVELDLWTSADAESKLPEWAVPNVEGLRKFFSEHEDRVRTIKAGGFPVLIKPVSPPRLRVLMHNLLFEPSQ